MTPTERIGELVAAGLAGNLDGRALQQAIGEHLNIPSTWVGINYEIDTRNGVEITIRAPR